jgi:hypothetical protein
VVLFPRGPSEEQIGVLRVVAGNPLLLVYVVIAHVIVRVSSIRPTISRGGRRSDRIRLQALRLGCVTVCLLRDLRWRLAASSLASSKPREGGPAGIIGMSSMCNSCTVQYIPPTVPSISIVLEWASTGEPGRGGAKKNAGTDEDIDAGHLASEEFSQTFGRRELPRIISARLGSAPCTPIPAFLRLQISFWVTETEFRAKTQLAKHHRRCQGTTTTLVVGCSAVPPAETAI